VPTNVRPPDCFEVCDDFDLHTDSTPRRVRTYLYHIGIFFAGGGEIEGRVTRSEWREHHLHVSALIADDEAFCEHIKCVWGRDGREGANREPYSDNGNNPNSAVSLSGNANSNRSRSSSVRGPENARSGAGASSDSNASQDGNGDEKISPKPASTTPREAWGPNPTPAAPPASNVERAPILRRGNERSGAATRLAVPPGVLNLLERVRGRLAARGMRAAFQLLRGFREEDRKGSGQVSLSGFKKAVGGTELGLKEAEMRIVFQVGRPPSTYVARRIFQKYYVVVQGSSCWRCKLCVGA